MAAPRYALPVVLLLALAGAALLASKLLDSIAKTAATGASGRAGAEAPADADADGAREVVLKDPSRFPEKPTQQLPPPQPEPPPLLPAERRRADFTARVEDPLGAPIPDVEVRLDSVLGGFEPGFEILEDRAVHRTMTSGADGRVRVAQLAEGAYRLRAHAGDGRVGRRHFTFRVADAESTLIVPLEGTALGKPGVELAVVGDDGAPVAGAVVELHGGVHDAGVYGDGRLPPLQATSDASGRATFAGLDWARGLATARAPDGRVGSLQFDASDRGRDSEYAVSATVVVQPGGRIAGRLVDAPGGSADALDRALAGATVDAFLATSQVPWYWTFGASFSAPLQGRAFELDALPPGDYSFVLHAPSGARLVLDRFSFGEKLANSVQPAIAAVKAGATTHVGLPATVGGTVRGRVHRADGTWVANASIVAVYAPRTSNFPDGFVLHGVNVWRFDQENEVGAVHPLTHVRARSDAQGEYVLAGLPPGEHRVIVTARGLGFDRREGVAVEDGKTTALDHELEPAGALQGIAPDDSYVGITRVGDARPTAIAILGGDRSFTFAGLRPGEYAVAKFHSDASVAPVEFARATVVAGRTTFVDCTDAPGPFEIAGRVLDATGAVADATVTILPRSARVDGAGRFTLYAFFPMQEFELRVRSRRLTWRFRCAAPPGERGWRGDLRLGEETLRIEAVGPRGAPLAGDVQLTREERPRSGDSPWIDAIDSERLPLDDSGRITLERLVPSRYALRFRFANGAEVVSNVDLPRADVLRVDVPACATLEVRVVDADGRPVEGWTVMTAGYLRDGAIPDDVEGHDEWFQWRSAVTDRRGIARIAGVRAGPVIVRVTRSDHWVRGAPSTTPPPTRLAVEEDEVRAFEIRLLPAQDGGR